MTIQLKGDLKIMEEYWGAIKLHAFRLIKDGKSDGAIPLNDAKYVLNLYFDGRELEFNLIDADKKSFVLGGRIIFTFPEIFKLVREVGK